MHLANSGRVILKLSKSLNSGQILFDKKNTKIAKVVETIGPVAKPFASATPLTNNIKKYSGEKVFIDAESPAIKQKKFRRRKK